MHKILNRLSNPLSFVWPWISIFILAITVILSGCVPKATEKKATCKSGQVFSNLARGCITPTNGDKKLSPSLSSLTLPEDTVKTVTLSYTDSGSDKAISCKVYDTDGQLEVYSPKISEAIIEFTKLKNAVSDAVSSHNTHYPAETYITAINSHDTDIQADLLDIKNGYHISTLMLKFENIYTKASDVYNLIKGNSSPSSLNTNNLKLRDLITLSKVYADSVSNRCFCDGNGVCTAKIQSISQSAGVGSFEYTLDDGIDGVSLKKLVTVELLAVNDLPFTNFKFTEISESGTSTPASSGAIAIPSSYDEDGDSLTFTKKTNPSLGTVSCTTTHCTYTPTNGDLYGVTAKVFGTATFYGVKFTAASYGAWSNDIQFQFLSHEFNERRFVKTEMFVEVSGTTVKIYVPLNYIFQASELVNILNAHPVLSMWGVFSDESLGASQTFSTLPSTYQTSGGSGGFDSFQFEVSDGRGGVSSTGLWIINILPANDAPTPVFVVQNPVQTVTRNGSTTNPVAYSTINLFNSDGTYYYTDPDATGNKAQSCQVSFSTFTPGGGAILDTTTIPSQAELGTCTCDPIDGNADDGKCQFELRSTYRTSPGVVTVYYAFNDGVSWSQTPQSMSLTILPQNVAPSFFGIAANLTNLNEDSNFTELISAPIWANDGISNDSEIVSGSMQQSLQYSMLVESLSNSSLYNSSSLADNFLVKYETCNPGCTSVNADLSTSLTDYKTLGTGNGVTGILKNLKVEFKPNAEQSGTLRITLRLKDSSPYTGETSLVSTDWVSTTITVDNVNDAPLVSDSDVITTVNDASPDTEVRVATVETAENSPVISRSFLVDEGGDVAEDADEVTLVNVTSDNLSLVPLNKIEPIFDRDGDGLFEDSATATADEIFNASSLPIELESFTANNNEDSKKSTGMLSGRKLYFKITPAEGFFGTANIRFQIGDNGTGTPTSAITYIITVIVHPINAIHGGWSHLSSKGISLKKNGSSLTEKFDCENNASIKKAGAPNGIEPATFQFETYYDTTYQSCYYSTQGSNNKNFWYALSTHCPMSNKCHTGSSKSCLFDSSVGTTIPTGLVEDDVYAVINTTNHQTTCYKVSNSTAVEFYPTEVTLSWNAFSISTSSGVITPVLNSYKIFRKKLNEEYDLSRPIGSVSSSILSYTDRTAFGGIAYHYKIVPEVTFDSKSVLVFPKEIFSEVRMTAPLANYSFVHRWMANLEVCGKMGMTTSTTAPYRVDPTNNYRCPYEGLGSNGGYYDIGADYLVDTYENGCPFTESPVCTVDGASHSCVGLSNPSVVAPSGSIYYSRGTGQCFYSDGSSWIDVNGLSSSGVSAGNKQSFMQSTKTHYNPPLVQVTKGNAVNLCALRPAENIYTNGANTATSAFSVPSRKEQIAFFAHPMSMDGTTKSYSEMNHTLIQNLENGESLNLNAHCNSNFASGVSGNYIDSNYPPSSLLYTLPGSQTSGIRSLLTGSIPLASLKGTGECLTRFGLQDAYGNVSEWVKDDLEWFDSDADTAVDYVRAKSTSTDFLFTAVDTSDVATPNTPYQMNMFIGPCNDSNGDNFCEKSVDLETPHWLIDEKSYNAEKWAFPVGLPFSQLFQSQTSYGNSPLITYLKTIGQVGGIENSVLHSDRFIMNTSSIGSGDVAISAGGSYSSGNDSGRYTLKLHSSTDKSAEIGFRCRAVINY